MSGGRIIRLRRGTEKVRSVYIGDPPPAAHAETVEAVRPSITKNAVINAFAGLHFDDKQWRRALGKDIPKWLEPCRVMKGKQGNSKISATWNPVLIAAALYGEEGKGVPLRKLDAVFVGLSDWADEWRELSASFRV